MKTVLVTGASTGIGEACATPLRGARLARAGRRAQGGRRARAAPRRCSSTSPTRRHRRRRRARRPARRARRTTRASPSPSPLEHLPLERAAAPARGERRRAARRDASVPAVLLRAARGRIVIVGSIAGKSALPFLGAYAMSKHALEAMADSLRVELAPDGIHVAIVEPGTIATPIWTKPQPLARRSCPTAPPSATASASRPSEQSPRSARRTPRRRRSSSGRSSTR